MPNFIESLKNYVSSVIDFYGFCIDAFYFSRKHLILKIIAESQNSQAYSYVLKIKSNEYVQSFIWALNNVVWSKPQYKMKNSVSRVDILLLEHDIMEAIDHCDVDDYPELTSNLNSTFFSYFDILPSDFCPIFFKVPKIIKKNKEFVLEEHINGHSLSELTYSLESIDENVFGQVGKALSELNHKWKIDLVDCHLRNFIVSENPYHSNSAISGDLIAKINQKYNVYLIDFDDAIKLNSEGQSVDFYRFVAHLLSIDGGIFDVDAIPSEIRLSAINRFITQFISSYREIYWTLTNNNQFAYRKSNLLQELHIIAKRRRISIDAGRLSTMLERYKSLESLN